jgi:hypothetical protein
LRKYDTDKWLLYVNESYDEPLGSTAYTYYATAKDVAGNENLTEIRTLNVNAAYPQVEFVGPTPANNTVTTNTSVEINVSIEGDSLDEVKFNWNGTNYSVYNDSLVLMMNFDSNDGAEISASESVGDGLVGLWHLNDNDTTDSSGNGNNGTQEGGLDCDGDAGKFGEACEFDGSSDWIDVDSLGDPSEGTISFWFKKPNINSGAQYLLDGRNSSGAGWWYLQDWVSGACTDASGNICFYGLVEIPSSYLSNDEWYFSVVTLDSTESRIYLNGDLIDVGDGLDPIFNDVRIATRYTGSSYFNGSMDEVGIWNRTLSATEIQELYERGLAEDDSRSNNDGEVIGPVTTMGKYEQGLEFDGVDDYVSLTNLSVDTAAGAKNTVEFWMYWDGTDIVMPFGWTSYDLYLVSDCFGFNTGESNVFGISSVGLSNTWIHVAAVFYNGVPSSSNSKLYINGVSQSISDCLGSTTASKSVSSSAVISGWNNNDGYKFGGKIDQVRIWNRSLTAGEFGIVL